MYRIRSFIFFTTLAVWSTNLSSSTLVFDTDYPTPSFKCRAQVSINADIATFFIFVPFCVAIMIVVNFADEIIM